MSILVHDPGLETTVQDTGRFGHYAIGFPPSGALDSFAYHVGNALVGNAPGAAALEAVYLGPTLEFTADTVIAVTGADIPATLDGEVIPLWESVAVRAGQTLAFGQLAGGARPYVAVAGGIDVPEVYGSRSTYTLVGMGGFAGRGLAAGDELALGDDAVAPRAGRRVPDDAVPVHPEVAELRLLVGLHSYRLTPDSLERFTDTAWKVTPDANRVGYRYRGAELEFVPREQPFGAGSDPANVTDCGYPVGSVQVPGGVEPIVLLQDAVTGGGYATLGTVVSVDRDRLAQTKTGDRTRFVPVDLDEALAIRHDRTAQLERLRSDLS
ncbi:biotin-dependent carboxyltransferase family protein [Actinomycetospora termitidis]|uniref:Biotin-dependent carboxyltransferase family protein n=1 Tax=Actinomycetospora termitidis TaxID=3053470 RepID=A0ABT7MCG1_9PSEU|nr:biotin-dependent carboxyltransferase family protein [Actinomycetospora sp. Odt1-22]MDL5157859.1 biotin-dependent carboxyltransferase family protein [Actinomycetospora sp. Odt1-22]